MAIAFFLHKNVKGEQIVFALMSPAESFPAWEDQVALQIHRQQTF
jgi:hypothetical protein